MNPDVGKERGGLLLLSSLLLSLPTLVTLLVIVTSVINRSDTIPIRSTQPHSINMLLSSTPSYTAIAATYELLCEEGEAVKYLDNCLVHQNSHDPPTTLDIRIRHILTEICGVMNEMVNTSIN